MRKRLWIAALLTALLLLPGCAGARERRDYAVTLRQPALTAAFTGTEENGELRGSFTGDDWRFEGTAASRKLTEGMAQDLPCVLDFDNTALSGRWTGPWAGGAPAGEGTFVAESGAVFAGTADRGAAREGQVGDMPLTLTWCGSAYTGAYTGTLTGGRPSGQGRFEGFNAVGQSLSWDGGWSEGAIAGAGTLRADRLLTEREGQEVSGTYDGAGADGLPAGQGVFSSLDAQGVPFTYTGAWAAGLMDGPGELRFDAENRYLRRGTFTGGCFTPTWLEAMDCLGTCEPRFELTEAQKGFLAGYPALWEQETHQTFLNSPLAGLFDSTVSLNRCFDDPAVLESPRWIRLYSLRTVRADAAPLFEGGPAVTRVLAADGTYQHVVEVIFPERVDDMIRGRRFHVFALPVAMSSYTTVRGLEQPCLVLIAGDIYLG